MNIKEVLFELSELNAISGMEYRAFDKVKELFSPYVTTVEKDALHNVIAIKKSKNKDAETLLLDAHMDEIGLVIMGVTDEGFLRVSNLNGVDRRHILAAEVTVHAESGDYYGIVTVKPPHLSTPAEKGKNLPYDEIYIDMGFSASKAKKLFKTGDFVTFISKQSELQGSIVTGKSFDDRACVVAILYAMEKLKDVELPFNIAVVLSAQEEVGMRGTRAATYAVKPTEAIALDVCHAHTPDASRDRTFPMSKGPVVTIAPILSREMAKKLIKIAGDENIPVQKDVTTGMTGTNAFGIFQQHEGVKTALISIAIKYMHSIVETLDTKDIKNTGKLLYEYIMNKKEEMQ